MATMTEQTLDLTVRSPRNPGMPLDLARVAAVAVIAAPSSAARRPSCAPDGQERVAGGVAAARHHLSRSDHPGRRRHAWQRPPALRQSAPPGARGDARGLGHRISISMWAPSASIIIWCRSPSKPCAARAFPSPPSRPAFPPGRILAAEARGDSRLGEAGRERDRHCHLARPRADRQLAGALRRSVRFSRGLRRGPYEDHPGHRRAGDAAQCRAGKPGSA